MTDTIATDTRADDELKRRQRALWASGDYGAVAREVIPTLGATLVEACAVQAGDRVLDVAAGTGNAALPAARRGASVTASDLTPELLDVGRRLAGELNVQWVVGDAERLPHDSAAFDVVLSCVGVMFAPHHRPAADELIRVCRPGGTIGLINWTPEGFIGRLFAALRPYAAAPPPGAQPPPLWGNPEHVAELFGDRVDDLHVERRLLCVDRFATPEQFRDFFRDNYGPTLAAYRNVADEPDRLAALDEALVHLAADTMVDGVMQWEYLLVLARRA